MFITKERLAKLMDEKILERLSLFIEWRKGNVKPSNLDGEMSHDQITSDLQTIVSEHLKLNHRLEIMKDEIDTYKRVYLTAYV